MKKLLSVSALILVLCFCLCSCSADFPLGTWKAVGTETDGKYEDLKGTFYEALNLWLYFEENGEGILGSGKNEEGILWAFSDNKYIYYSEENPDKEFLIKEVKGKLYMEQKDGTYIVFEKQKDDK